MVITQSDGVSFRHELARLAVEEALPPHRRVALHRAARRGARRPPERAATRLGSRITPTSRATRRRSCASRPRQPRAPRRSGAHREAAAQYARALRFADAPAAARSRPSCWSAGPTRAISRASSTRRSRAGARPRPSPSPRRPASGGRLPALPLAPVSLPRPHRDGRRGRPAGGRPPRGVAPGRELALAYVNLGHLYTVAEDAEAGHWPGAPRRSRSASSSATPRFWRTRSPTSARSRSSPIPRRRRRSSSAAWQLALRAGLRGARWPRLPQPRVVAAAGAAL